MKDNDNDATSKATMPVVRFATKGSDVFAYVCSWKEKKVMIKSLSLKPNYVIKGVTIVGSSKKEKWKQTNDGLQKKMNKFDVPEILIIGFRVSFKE